MQAADLQQQKAVYERQRQRFVVRQQFFRRCAAEVDEDFHKQYGPFENDWRSMHDACLAFDAQIEEYLLHRDVGVIECNLIATVIEETVDKQAADDLEFVYSALLEEAKASDTALLSEHDENVATVRSVYKMIAHKEECGS